MSERVLLTGGGGQLGAAVWGLLAAKDVELDVLVRPSWEPRRAPAAAARTWALDIAARDHLRPLVARGYSRILHLAGQTSVRSSVEDPRKDLEANLLGTFNLLELARETGARFTLASSIAVLDPANRLPLDETSLVGPSSPYGAAKAAAEHYCQTYSRCFGVACTVVRFCHIYGPGFVRCAVWDIANRILAGAQRVELIGGGSQVRDFMFASDAARALWELGSAASPFAVYHAASGEPLSVRTLAQQIAIACGRTSVEIAAGEGKWTGDTPDEWYADGAKARKAGFRASVPLDEGLRRTVEWIASQRSACRAG